MLTVSATAVLVGGSSYLQWGSPDSAIPLAALARLLAISAGAAVIATAAAAVSATIESRREVLRQE
jgi:hypothetical protein